MTDEIPLLNEQIVSQFSGFYLLEHIVEDSSPINVYVKTIDGDVESPVSNLISRLPDGRLVACIDASFQNLKFHNLVAKNDSSSEIINIQTFERLRRYISLDGRNDSKSHFFFYNSIPVVVDSDDDEFNISTRCNLNLLGPETFIKNDGPLVPLVDYNHIYVYEPILSVNGIAHFGYANTNTDIEWYSNEDPFPRVSFTLQEGLKQICEWASVGISPWNNSETISSRALEMLNALHFSSEEISNIHSTQPNMQIYKYLSGDVAARTRPLSAGELTNDIYSSIVKRLSHFSIRNFLTTHGVETDTDTLVQYLSIQNNHISSVEQRLIEVSEVNTKSITESNVNEVKAALFKRGRVFTGHAIMADTVVSMKVLNTLE